MKLLIVGIKGFLGSNLKKFFRNKGYKIYSISYRPATIKKFKQKLEKLIIEKKITTIINASADQSSNDEFDTLEALISSNIYLPCILAKVLSINNNGLLINFGSSWEYLNGKISPYNAYAASKSAANNFFRHFALKGVKITSLALSDTYGIGDTRNKILNLMINALRNSKKLDMTAGEQHIDLIHINDVCAAVENIILNESSLFKNENFKIFRLATGKRLTVKELSNLIYSLLGKKTQKNIFQLGKRNYHERERFSLEHFTPDLPGWKPMKSLEAEIKVMLDNNEF